MSQTRLILARPFHVIDHEHIDYGSLRFHAKAEFLKYVEQGWAVRIGDGGHAALRSAIQAGSHGRPTFGLDVIETREPGLVEEWPVSPVLYGLHDLGNRDRGAMEPALLATVQPVAGRVGNQFRTDCLTAL